MPQFQHRGNLPVNVGGGHFIMPGQRVELTVEQASAIPGLEPVLEREPQKPTLERIRGRQAIERTGGHANITEDR